ncbi:hypothetical protein ACVI1J_000770 [Bradyrhizobium diazoefficiens]
MNAFQGNIEKYLSRLAHVAPASMASLWNRQFCRP